METVYQNAKKAAEKVLKDNYVTTPPVRIDEIAKNYGLIIVEADLDHDSNISGFIDIKNKRIVLNKYDPEPRKAYTIAHELGHYLMHKDKLEHDPDKYAIFYRRPIGAEHDPIEEEASCFAAHLLVPQELLNQYKDYDNNTIATIFGVPVDVIGLRRGGAYGSTN